MKKSPKKLTLARESLRLLDGGATEIYPGEPGSQPPYCPAQPLGPSVGSCTREGSTQGCCSYNETC